MSKYRSVLVKLKSMGFMRVFSGNLADAVGVSPALVRKDLSFFGLSGNKRGGYRVEELIDRMNRILGKDEAQKVIIAGCGNMGMALIRYSGFIREEIQIAAAFDTNPARLDPHAPVPILDAAELPGFVEREGIRVAILTVPENEAARVAETLMACGIRGILNFAPVSLKGAGVCVVHNINIALEIENLFCLVHLAQQENRGDRPARG